MTKAESEWADKFQAELLLNLDQGCDPEKLDLVLCRIRPADLLDVVEKNEYLAAPSREAILRAIAHQSLVGEAIEKADADSYRPNIYGADNSDDLPDDGGRVTGEPVNLEGVEGGSDDLTDAEAQGDALEKTTVRSNRGPSARELAVVAARQEIVNALTDEPQSSAEITTICSAADARAVSRALSTAIRLGMAVHRVAQGVFSLPPAAPEPEPGAIDAAAARKRERRKELERERHPERGLPPPPCPRCGRIIRLPGPYARSPRPAGPALPQPRRSSATSSRSTLPRR